MKIFAWCLLFIGMFVLPASYAKDALRVVVSIKPMHSIVAGLMEGVEAPELLIDDQVPYSFKPTKAQLASIQNADILFWVGAELEPGLAEAIGQLSSQVEVIELLSHQGLKVLPSRSQQDLRDPFFWLDNRNLMIIIDDITRLLQATDPLRTHLYERNRRNILTRLSRIDREYEYGYRGMKAGLGLQYFDTLQYFEQAYALKVIDHVAGSPIEAIDTAALLKAREKIAMGEASCLLSEKGFPAKHVSLLLDQSEANHGELNSLGFGMQPGPDLYFEVMDHNTDVIKHCLNADMKEAASARALAKQERATAIDGIGSGQFLLTDHLGRLVSKETMKGKYQIVYFGYTFCPDICPTSLQVLFQAMDILGEKSELFQPYFITIDPTRDNVAVMRNYVQYYDERLIGVTGSSEMIGRVAAQFKAKYEKVEEAGNSDPDMYLMDHTASLYILDPEGRFLTKFAHGIEPEDVASQLLELVSK
ncbi:MAG: SCO family protein [Candidatus Thiodiazotropha sp. (ex Monitilora ramsayi)]|nr:SCO family protein [Candidatus Thiodiazotropha sp. (ex Monitilora ramsayi)]